MARRKNPAYLYFRDNIRLLHDDEIRDRLSSAHLPGGREQEILNSLVDKGVHTYGQLVEFCAHNRLTKEIPGIEPEAVESIQSLVLFREERNKSLLAQRYDKAQEEIARLKQSTKQLDKAAIDGREIAKSM